MKKAIVAVALMLVAAGLYFKFRSRIDEGIDAVKKEAAQGGSPAAPVLNAVKNVVPGSPPPADEKIPLADAEFVRKLPGSLAAAGVGSAKPDIVLEVMGVGGTLPQLLLLAPGVWLDLAALQLAGTSVPPGTKILVHLQTTGPAGGNLNPAQQHVHAASEPIPKSLNDALSRGRWRNSVSMPAPSEARQQPPYLWATAFEKKAERDELHGVVHVEGTFGSVKRASGNAANHAITLEECKRVQFYFPRGSIWEKNAFEAETLKKQGNRVTMRMTIDLDSSPKYLAQSQSWGVPLKDKLEYWQQAIGSKGNLINTLALAGWCEAREMNDEAKALCAKAHNEVTAEFAARLGNTSMGVRVHLLDEVQDHWFFEVRFPVGETGHHVTWKGRAVAEEFYATPVAVCVIFHTNARGESTGDYYLLEP